MAPVFVRFVLQISRQFQRRNTVARHILPIAAVRLLAAFHPGKAPPYPPTLVTGQPVGTPLHAVDTFLGARQNQAIIEALHITQLGRGIEDGQRCQGLLTQITAPTEFVVIGFDRLEIGSPHIEATARVAQLHANVRQLEALAEGGIYRLPADG
ncbi:hypothetical protein D3C79_818960 [compost metagenome]